MSVMKWRRTAILIAVTALLVSGCDGSKKDESPGQAIEILAGGGSNAAATKALDAKLTGALSDFKVGRDGVIRVLSYDNRHTSILEISPDGRLQRIDLATRLKGASQVAAADDGTLYVSSPGPTGAVFRVDAGDRLVPVVGNGKIGLTSDGGRATGPSGFVLGITVDRQGRLVYGESRSDGSEGHSSAVLRRVEADGTITTIAGNPTVILAGDAYTQAGIKSVAPPDGTKSLGWPLPGVGQLDSLAVEDDGTIVAQSFFGVLAFGPDGAVKAVARRRDADAAPARDVPFTDEGDAADAAPDFVSPPSALTAGDGYVAMTVMAGSLSSRLPAYQWAGEHSPGQQAIIDASASDGVIVRLVKPDGRLTTAAAAAHGGGVHDGWLYLAAVQVIRDSDDTFLIGRVKLPAA